MLIDYQRVGPVTVFGGGPNVRLTPLMLDGGRIRCRDWHSIGWAHEREGPAASLRAVGALGDFGLPDVAYGNTRPAAWVSPAPEAEEMSRCEGATTVHGADGASLIAYAGGSWPSLRMAELSVLYEHCPRLGLRSLSTGAGLAGCQCA